MKKFLIIFFIILSISNAKGNFFLGFGTDFTHQEIDFGFTDKKSEDWNEFTKAYQIRTFSINFNLGYEILFFNWIGLRPMLLFGYGNSFASKNQTYNYQNNTLSIQNFYRLNTQTWLDFLLNFPIQKEKLDFGIFFGSGANVEYSNSTFREKSFDSSKTIYFNQRILFKQFLTRFGITFKINMQHRIDLFTIIPIVSIFNIQDTKYGNTHFKQIHNFLPDSASIAYYFLF